MKKLFSLFLASILSLALLTGCASNTVGNSTDDNTQPGETTNSTIEPIGMNILALKGPTAMGMVHFMNAADSGDLTDNQYEFSILAATDEIGPKLIKGEADIAAIPANLAANLYNNTDGKLQVLAINTLGVLYIAESGDSISSVEDLRGKTIYASGKGTTPEYALNYILSQNGIDPATDVTIEWKSEQAECLAALTAKENAIAMLPQPFVTTAQSKNDAIQIALDLTEEWDKLETNNDAPSTLITGVVVARTDFIQENPGAIDAFLEHYQESVSFVNSNVEEAAEMVGNYEIVTAEIAQKALPACNITFITGDEMQNKLSGYLKVLFEQNPKSVGDSLPEDDFYYKK